MAGDKPWQGTLCIFGCTGFQIFNFIEKHATYSKTPLFIFKAYLFIKYDAT